MRDLLILLVHLIATLARLLGPGGLWSASVTSTSRMTNRSVDV